MTPKRTLHEDFRKAYAFSKSKGAAAFLADWPQPELSRTRNAAEVRATPRMVTSTYLRTRTTSLARAYKQRDAHRNRQKMRAVR